MLKGVCLEFIIRVRQESVGGLVRCGFRILGLGFLGSAVLSSNLSCRFYFGVSLLQLNNRKRCTCVTKETNIQEIDPGHANRSLLYTSSWQLLFIGCVI